MSIYFTTGITQNFVTQFISLAPEYASTIIMISPDENFKTNDVNTILKKVNLLQG